MPFYIIYYSMSERDPWYVENSEEPEGEFGEDAMTNPENRQGVQLHYPDKYNTWGVKKSLKKGLDIIKEDSSRVVMIGGDFKGSIQNYHHIRWDSRKEQYIISDEENTKRVECTGTRDLVEYLSNQFEKDSFVRISLIYVVNSPFNTSGPS